MNTLIQSQVIEVPVTVGTTIYKTQFASDKNFKFVSGIACLLVSGSVAQDIEIEFKDDNETIFTFSPAQNWVKDSEANNKDLTNIFRPVNIVSKGRNIYCSVKATDTDEVVKFVVYYLQVDSEEGVKVKPYNFETYRINFASLPEYKNITLPNRYRNVAGIAAVTSSAAASKILVHVENTQKNLVDPIQLSAINVNAQTAYDLSFLPVVFPADGQELKLYFTAADSVTGPVSAKVYFLLTD